MRANEENDALDPKFDEDETDEEDVLPPKDGHAKDIRPTRFSKEIKENDKPAADSPVAVTTQQDENVNRRLTLGRKRGSNPFISIPSYLQRYSSRRTSARRGSCGTVLISCR